jgi:hypothetical protein
MRAIRNGGLMGAAPTSFVTPKLKTASPTNAIVRATTILTMLLHGIETRVRSAHDTPTTSMATVINECDGWKSSAALRSAIQVDLIQRGIRLP